MASISNQALLANAKWSMLSKKYGDDPDKWRMAGAATLMGADVVEGYNKWAQASMNIDAINKRQEEIQARADISIANLAQQSESVQAAQAVSYIKSGVKLEGSALDVRTETANNAMEAEKIRQREADFEQGQMEVEKAINATKAKYATFETLLNMGGSAAMMGVK